MEIKLTDLIHADMLQKIQDAFSNATGMAALTVDLDGPVTSLSNPTHFCMNLTRGNTVGAERCNICDLKGGEEAGRTGRPAVYYCHGGLMDFAAPILLGNKQIGSLIGGQVLPEPPDEQKFRQIARDMGVSEEEYLKALSDIKIVPKKTIEASAHLLYVMANALSDMGYQRYMTEKLTDELMYASVDMGTNMKKAFQDLSKIGEENTRLVSGMDSLSVATNQSMAGVEKTNQIVKYINDVSMQTKLLGFNASVEAARAGQAGLGFAVIAQEIRRLADTSQQQYGQIGDIFAGLKNNVGNIDSQILKTHEMVKKSTELLNSVTAVVAEIDRCAKHLESLGQQLKNQSIN